MSALGRSHRQRVSLIFLTMALVGFAVAVPAPSIHAAQSATITATATATPAAPDLQLRLIAFDPAQYPTLKAVVAVWDKNAGQPRLGLAPTDFSAKIDLTPVTIANVNPWTLTRPVQIVLVIDNSLTDDASLSSIKTAASRLVDGLGVDDQAALLTAADTTQIVTPLTGDREKLKADLVNVRRVVTKTSLHQGLADAVGVFNAAPATGALRLIVAITNTGDNARPTFPPDQVASQALAASVAIYAVDFGGTDLGNSLDSLARQTGGRYLPLSNADQIDAALQTILPALQQGYEVSFVSPVPGDGREYAASLSLAAASTEPPVEARFVAPLVQVAVNGPGLTDGQTVIGAVHLNTAAVVPAPPIASVEYRLDGQTFATLTQPPYSFQWDSTSVNPGSHKLTVVVRDSDGNSGEVEVTVLVTIPFAVTASSDREQVPLGDKVVVRAQVSSPARIDRVEFWQDDDTLLFSDATAPYEYVFDTKGQQPGVRSFRVQAVDYLGRSAETDAFEIELQPTLAAAAPGILRWVLIGLISVAILAVLLVALFGSLAFSARLKRRLKTIYPVEILNDGNLRSRYQLRAETALDALNLEFQLQGAALPVQALAVVPPKPVWPAYDDNRPAAAEGLSIGAVKETGTYKTYQKATGAAEAVAGFLNTIADLLPRGAGAQLRGTAASLRRGEQVGRDINRADRRIQTVQHATSDTTASLGVNSSQPNAPAPAAPEPRERPAVGETWALTPYVEAGEKLSLQLCARPLKSTRTQTYAVRILSRLVEAPDLAPVSEAGNITVTGLSRLQRLQPFLLALAMLAVAIGLMALLAWIWGG